MKIVPVCRISLLLKLLIISIIFFNPKTDKITNAGTIGEIYRILITLLKNANPKNKLAKASIIFFSLLTSDVSAFILKKAKIGRKRSKGLSLPSKY